MQKFCENVSSPQRHKNSYFWRFPYLRRFLSQFSIVYACFFDVVAKESIDGFGILELDGTFSKKDPKESARRREEETRNQENVPGLPGVEFKCDQ